MPDFNRHVGTSELSMRFHAMRKRLLLFLVTLAGCGRQDVTPETLPSGISPREIPSAVLPDPNEPPPPHAGPAPSATPFAPEVGTSLLTREEWKKADNRNACAPLAFLQTGNSFAQPRRANFAGGWGVAYDTPTLRSAFGIAGAGLIDADRPAAPDQRARLARQWPYFRDLPNLPAPAFAGYGIEGASAYPADNADGKGVNSVAYLRVGSQTCTYNVWSRLGRAHLEFLLENLTTIDPK